MACHSEQSEESASALSFRAEQGICICFVIPSRARNLHLPCHSEQREESASALSFRASRGICICLVIPSIARNLHSRFFVPILCQIRPCRINGLDQRNLLRARPFLDLRLARDCILYLLIIFKIHKTIDPISLGEALIQAFFMLPNPCPDAVRHSCIKSERPAGHNVDVEPIFTFHAKNADSSLRSE